MTVILPGRRIGPESLTDLGEYAALNIGDPEMADAQTVKVDGETAVVQAAPGAKNWRTLGLNAAVVLILAGATWAAGIDWTQYVSPTLAMIILAVANFLLRFFTNGPAMSNVSVKLVG